MKIRKRFLAWSLIGIFLTVGFSGFGKSFNVGYAAEPVADSSLKTSPQITKSGTSSTGTSQIPQVEIFPASSVSTPDAVEESADASQIQSTENSPESSPDTTEAMEESADALQIPESEASSESAIEEEGSLNLPDFEPRLPAENFPEEVADPTWNEVNIESAGDDDTPKISKRQQILMAADEYYLAGDRETAEALYRQVKDSVWQVDPSELRPEPIFDPAELPPAAAVYWREAQAGYEQGLTHRTLVPLELMVEEYPEFIPAHVFYANYLMEQEQSEEADAILDKALIVYPTQPELLRARTSAQMKMEQWVEAAITAKQFTLFNPDHPDVEEMDALSQENMDRFRAEMNAELTQNFVGNLLIGAAGAILTGGLVGPYTALSSAAMLMRGESAVGDGAAAQIQDQLPMMDDRQINDYLNDMGQKLAALAGRDEFDYDFYVVEDEDLNAFALPGGKIFINAGAILKAHSEAEMAGLMAHEISHTVLSHGFQMATNGNLINSIASMVPIPQVGGIAAALAFSSYSREMERQADILGTQILSAAGYAADGLHNMMVTLQEEAGDRGGIQWFSSHPAPIERVDYLKQIVEVGGFNRYAYEGMETHLAMQRRVEELMQGS